MKRAPMSSLSKGIAFNERTTQRSTKGVVCANDVYVQHMQGGGWGGGGGGGGGEICNKYIHAREWRYTSIQLSRDYDADKSN